MTFWVGLSALSARYVDATVLLTCFVDFYELRFPKYIKAGSKFCYRGFVL